jgi:hypothetical protein
MSLDATEQFVADLADAIKEATRPLLKRIEELETAAKAVPDVDAMVQRAVTAAVAAIPKPENGKDAEPVDVDAIRSELKEFLGAEVAKIPRPQDGKSVTVDDVRPILVDETKEVFAEIVIQAKQAFEQAEKDLAAKFDSAIAAIPKPVDGKSVAVEDVLPELLAAAQEAVDNIPKPSDGKSVTVDDVLPVLERAMESLHAKWELDFERRAAEKFERAIDRMPKPKDGKDGLGFDDLSVDFDGERLVTLNFVRGDIKKSHELLLPVIIDRGIFKDGSEYKHFDSVTFGGSLFIAQKDAPQGKPGASDDWRLSVKRGRDGKDGLNGKDYAPRGPVKLS